MRHGDIQTCSGILLDDIERDGATRLVVGPACSGKTELALNLVLEGRKRYGDNTVMTVSGRVAADVLSNRLIREWGASSQARPVTTLGAVAFRIIAASRAQSEQPAPRLLNGAEQDALLRRVMAVHVKHAAVGDECATCDLLREYFAQRDWARLVRDASAPDAHLAYGAAEQSDEVAGTTSDEAFARGISGAFIDQLRDMLARLDELGVGKDDEAGLLAHVDDDWRLRVQWRLAFVLRQEYIAAQIRQYPGEYRLDASYLMVAGARAVDTLADGPQRGKRILPQLLVVDDVQDITLAGLRFLESLKRAGVHRIVLIGNPDEAVQTFRGSYPEYLMRRFITGPLQAVAWDGLAGGVDARPADAKVADAKAADIKTADAQLTDLQPAEGEIKALDVLASRISLSIPSPEEEDLPIARRPGKLTAALSSEQGGAALADDDTLRTLLYRSAREELDDVVWRIKRAHLDRGMRWNDMAVIAHDNTTVRLFGERLRRDGVPVRYSSVTRPLKDESFVQGLFALIDLARLREHGIAGSRMGLSSVAGWVRSRVSTLMNSPLITTGAKPGQGMPARLAPIDAAMEALESLAPVMEQARRGGDAEASQAATLGESGLASVMSAWATLCETFRETHCETGRETSLGHLPEQAEGDYAASVDSPAQSPSSPSSSLQSVQVDDALMEAQDSNDLAFGADAIYAMLGFDDPAAPAQAALHTVGAVLGTDPQYRAFANLWHLVDAVRSDLAALPTEQRRTPLYALSAAWNATGVAPVWQRAALGNTPASRAANDRLDVAMRLFQFAEDNAAGQDIDAFIEQVRGMQMQADSLAHIGPVEDAVTLTTPAGAAGRHWEYVWLPAVQQDVWPNLAERTTMFGGEDLAELVLHGSIGRQIDASVRDPRLASVLASEKKSLLVALTRARRGATMSAVWNDDASPSDFLFGYMPECYPRDRSALERQGGFTTVGTPHSQGQPNLSGLDADPRGLVAASRVALATADPSSPEAHDAAAALALLANRGLRAANPESWSFVGITPSDSELSDNTALDSTVSVGTVSADVPAHSSSDPTPTSAFAVSPASASEPTAANTQAPVVTLSPSAVDGLWACPVCWLLEHRFAGPSPSSVNANFGTLIHEIARRGSEEGLDRLDDAPQTLSALGLDASATQDQRCDAVAERLYDIYQSLRPDPTAIADAPQRYAAIRKDESAKDVLANIADYFVTSTQPDVYLGKNAANFAIGTLVEAECEKEFAARFSLDDILAAYNAVPGMQPIDKAQLSRIMATLVSGWPEGMSDDLEVRLSGRIDRLEKRVLADGRSNMRLIDYKTGKTPTVPQIVNDLQLVCYQLGLTFPEGKPRGAQALAKAPNIGQSALFHVAEHAAPATSWETESLFQPPLFTDGTLNAQAFTARFRYKNPDSLFDMPVPDANNVPEGVSAQAWQQFAALAGTQTLWSLTMIARVFYAAAASRSATLTAHPTAVHVKGCSKRQISQVCPACGGQIDTVFETRQA
ncbi:PD-(D/E)XK nuclease family protein [Bifidobacterium oedipodis]|uniref:UvrD4 n=1 Tax=Bifidobacterium oedipodis TaxID=2675322 RepID=A0A7Y0ENX4_9BIFI|nr:UvrD4 [Bifidobacterium sp. DSM 109957]